ncbi:MAG: shikimate kinase [Melioribacteraceae bacterium]|jgi:shikimate kinase|nr:shikimate kinase [Melioribacteraceae bacterium]
METQIERIYLTGFMTSGKSTIGPILANVLGWEFNDLDRVIEDKEGKTVVEIFNTNGEEYFRDLEHNLLSTFSTSKKLILSLGGGTIAFDRNLEILKNSGKIVYLKSSPEMIYKRIKNKIDRPIFRDLVLSENPKPQDFIDRIDKYLTLREPYYLEADIHIDTDQSSIGITVDKLAKLLNRVIHEKN